MALSLARGLATMASLMDCGLDMNSKLGKHLGLAMAALGILIGPFVFGPIGFFWDRWLG